MNLQDIDKSIVAINNTLPLIEEGEISPIVAYKYFKKWSGIIENATKLIEGATRDMVDSSPLEHKEFTISTRRTYDFSSSEYYKSKLDELHIEENNLKLKEVEKLIKTATDMDKTLYDENGEAIEKVDVKYSQILTYRPKKEI